MCRWERKQGEKEVNLVDKSSRQSERSGKNIRPSVQKSRDAPELIRTEKQSEDLGQSRNSKIEKESVLKSEKNPDLQKNPSRTVRETERKTCGSIRKQRRQPEKSDRWQQKAKTKTAFEVCL